MSRTATLSFRVPPLLHGRLRLHSIETATSMSDICLDALGRYLDEQPGVQVVVSANLASPPSKRQHHGHVTGRAHLVREKNKMAWSKPVPDSRCSVCGRRGLGPAKGAGKSELLQFHYAPPPCGRPCVGGTTHSVKREDAPDGLHLAERCACKKATP